MEERFVLLPQASCGPARIGSPIFGPFASVESSAL